MSIESRRQDDGMSVKSDINLVWTCYIYTYHYNCIDMSKSSQIEFVHVSQVLIFLN